MILRAGQILAIFVVCLCSISGAEESMPLKYDAGTYEYIRGLYRDTIFMTDGAEFRHGGGYLKSDTAILIKGEKIILLQNVLVEDSLYNMTADRVVYDINNRSANAYGDTVVIFSSKDSIMATGSNAYYHRDSSILRMADYPKVELNYPDTSRMVQIYSEFIALDAESRIGYADGHVSINQNNTTTKSDRAIMYMEDDILLLLGEPSAVRNKSEIKGDTLIMFSENSQLKQIYVTGNGEGTFKEPKQNDSTLYDISELKGGEIEFNFRAGELNDLKSSGQAYSYYFPAIVDSSEIAKNIISGDTLYLDMIDGEMSSVEVIGGAEGEYLTGKYKSKDSALVFIEDTVKYNSEYIKYTLKDSIISLDGKAAVDNKTVSLKAHRIDYNTSSRLVFAFDDSILVDTTLTYIPVVLNDGGEEIIGSYLEYSMVTEKGLIKQSQSDYQDAYYSGKELFRREKDVFYVDDGIYTTCDHKEPHFRFRSKNMKMIQGDKVIARPVIFYIEKVPLLIVPYYVFPTKQGRHSGFLSFQFGNFSRGNRYISNVGYYWAASEYWDIKAAIDYREDYNIVYRSTFRYNTRYKFNGSVTGEYTNQSTEDAITSTITKRYKFAFNHSQTISPTFSIKADGQFLSDKSYYTAYSTNLDDRLNRNIRSQVSLSKRFSFGSLTAQFVHDVALDTETRTDKLPTLSFSLKSFQLFGSPGKDDDGNDLSRWYHGIRASYNSSLNNYSYRTTDLETGLRSRKEHATIDHNASLSFSQKVLKYLNLSPSVRYRETWYKIYQTDQSDTAGIDASTTYRRFSYSAGISAETNVYGTYNINISGLQGLRHVLTPRVSYSWAPEISRHSDIKSYTGVGGGGAKSSSLTFSLKNLFQAKVKSGEDSKKLDILSVNSNFSYDFEAEGKKFSDLRTSMSTSLLKNITFNFNMTHNLYKPGTEELHWRSPYLEFLSVSTRYSTSGSLGDYDSIDDNNDDDPKKEKGISKQTWNLSTSYYYSESRSVGSFTKSHKINFALSAKLTPSIDISYNQDYNFTDHKTAYRKIEVRKNMHCWNAMFFWIPNGSNEGFYFKINIMSIPDIKFEKSETGIASSYF